MVASSLPGDTERLAGVAADEDIDGWGVCEFSYVGVAGNTGEVSLEDSAAVGVCFAHPGVLSSDGEVEASDSAEKGSDIHAASLGCSISASPARPSIWLSGVFVWSFVPTCALFCLPCIRAPCMSV